MRKLIERCPGCGGDLAVTRLSCPECEIEITGRFRTSLFDRLSPENLAFAETFLRLRGNVREMERELGVPYNTVRGRLDEVIAAMGFDNADSGEAEAEEKFENRSEGLPGGTRAQILERLDRGEITASEAADLLSALGLSRRR
jgi:hypothetical protein